MRTTSVRLAFALHLLCIAGPPALAQQQCTFSDGNNAHYSSVRLDFSSVPSMLHSGIMSGMGAWNDTSCNTNDSAFPRFVDSGPADVVIPVEHHADINPRAPYACTEIFRADNGSSAVIKLYSRALVDGEDTECPTGEAAIADAIAHELGHYLGLNHSPCPNYIMSSATLAQQEAGARQVQLDECAKADAINQTPNEYGPPPGGGGGGGGGGGDEGGGGEGGGGGGGGWYAIDCGSNGTWDYVVYLNWWDDPISEGDRMCNMT